VFSFVCKIFSDFNAKPPETWTYSAMGSRLLIPLVFSQVSLHFSKSKSNPKDYPESC